jgi:hypothetical protein
MNLNDIKKIARQMGIRTGGMKKDEIIRSIQRAEGDFDCFGTAISGDCSQTECLWRPECLLVRQITT